MATHNITPRGDGEGNIGDSLLRWLKGWFVSIFVSGNITDGTHDVTVAEIREQIDNPSVPDADEIATDDSGETVQDKIDTIEGSLQEVQDLGDYGFSPMIVTGGDITKGTNAGTFKVAELTAEIRATDSFTGELTYITLATQDNQVIEDPNTVYIIFLDYNDGNPQIVLSVTNLYVSGADKTLCPIGRVMKDGSDDVHYVSGGYNFQDGVRKLHQRAKDLRNFELASGNTIEYQATNQFTMTQGTVYGGINRYITDVYDSNETDFIPFYSDGGAGFTYGAETGTIDYEHYDDGSGSLGEVGVAKYACFWVYVHIDDGHIYLRYGECTESLAEAGSLSASSSVLPSFVKSMMLHLLLSGRKTSPVFKSLCPQRIPVSMHGFAPVSWATRSQK